MEEKKDMLWRIYLVYIGVCVFALSVLGRVIYIQAAQGDKWKKVAENNTVARENVEALRGNIFAVDGSLLATSVPYYDIVVDPLANEFIDDVAFRDSVNDLSKKLYAVLKRGSVQQYARDLMAARANKSRYCRLVDNVSFQELQEIKKLPLLRLGRYKGGFMPEQKSRRERLFGDLAARTIGYTGDSGRAKVGLEGAYDTVLTGISGQRLVRKIAGGVKIPINSDNEIEPQDGRDIVSTIDINVQDVAENALRKSLTEHDARYGLVVLMEVQTGEIRAIANLTRRDSGHYVEDYNYAIGAATEPGSTFKLASMLVAMDDGYVEPQHTVDLEGGFHRYSSGGHVQDMKDAHTPTTNEVTVQHAFEMSSNVGISKIVSKYYSGDPGKFIDGLHRLHLDTALGLSIPGEGKPLIRKVGAKGWSSFSLPWISIGYESQVTSMQTLSLYNAVANNGVMVKPMFVKEVRQKGKTLRTFKPEVIDSAIVKKETIRKMKQLLEGVVENGTARNLATSVYKIAGKTGTAQIASGGTYGKDKGKVTYQASFVGYFPAEKPKYTCIVMVNAPSGDVYYGGSVAGPIFKRIADRVYATDLDIHSAVNDKPSTNPAGMPEVKTGFSFETKTALNALRLPVEGSFGESEYASVKKDGNGLALQPDDAETQLRNGLMPDVTGMPLTDALYLLENKKLRVKVIGTGAVKKQSIAAGTKILPGNEIVIELGL